MRNNLPRFDLVLKHITKASIGVEVHIETSLTIKPFGIDVLGNVGMLKTSLDIIFPLNGATTITSLGIDIDNLTG
jgi:hypothetical protein